MLALALTAGSLSARDYDNDNEGRNQSPGAVYTMDNSAGGNHVLAYNRAANGALTPAGVYATGGLGTGTGLGSQNALVLSRDGNWLFACNAGSDEISVFGVTPQALTLVSKVKSEGHRPISLALHKNLLYVLNAGGAVGDKDNITGFIFAFGTLLHGPNSTEALSTNSTGPAQISFTREGDTLIVTEKATSLIDTYSVGDDGLVTDHKTFTSPVPTPFGFAVGKQERIFVSEANGGAALASSVSSYLVSDAGDLASISSGVATKQSAACWVVITDNQAYAYTSNTGSGSISGYGVSYDGKLQLLNSSGINGTTGAGSKPIDLALSRHSRFLYSLNSGNGSISGFSINADGSLLTLTPITGIPTGANGLAAK